MKLNRDLSEETLIIGGEEELSFSIDAENGVIFDILRDKMYSNKIGSIVREVASNSRDANRESGNGDKSISLIITKQYSELLPEQYCMVFRDLGPGITEKRMADVFVKYAASTKRHTNAQTGGFGLGAKTPFAYTDSFYIHTIAWTDVYIGNVETGVLDRGSDESVILEKSRMKKSYFYNALIDESGVGKMILLESEILEDQEKPTGTDIIVPLNNGSDKQRFADECMYYTSLWDNVEYQGVREASYKNFERSNIVVDTPTYMVVENKGWGSPFECGVYAIVDGIPYPIGDREDKEIKQIHRGLKDHTFFLKFSTGEVSVSATREQIEFNEKTIEAIKRVFKRSLNSIVQEFQKELDKMDYLEGIKSIIAIFAKQKELFQDSRMLKGYNGVLIKTIYENMEDYKLTTKLKFGGKTVEQIVRDEKEGKRFSLKNRGFEVLKVSKDDAGKYSVPKSLNLLSHTNLPIYVMDARKDRRRNYTILQNNREFLLLRPFGGMDMDLTPTQYDIFSSMLFEFNIDIQLYSEVEKQELPASEKNEYVPGETVDTRWRKVSPYSDLAGSSKVIEVNRKDGQFKDFLGEEDFILLTDKLGDFSLDRRIGNALGDLKINLYVTTTNTYDRYFKGKVDETRVFIENNREKLLELLKERRLEKLLGDLNKGLLKQSITLLRSLERTSLSYGSGEFNIRSDYYRTDVKRILLLGIIDKRVGSFFRIVFKVNPSVELARFIIENEKTILKLRDDIEIDEKTLYKIKGNRYKLRYIFSNVLKRFARENYILSKVLIDTTDTLSLKEFNKLTNEVQVIASIVK